MKYFIKKSEDLYVPISDIYSIQKLDGYADTYEVHFKDGSQIRITDFDNSLNDSFIG